MKLPKIEYPAQVLCCQKACRKCGSISQLQVDHIKPRSKFPELALNYDNLQVLCETCNLDKGDRV